MKITAVSEVTSGPNPHDRDAWLIYSNNHAITGKISQNPGATI